MQDCTTSTTAFPHLSDPPHTTHLLAHLPRPRQIRINPPLLNNNIPLIPLHPHLLKPLDHLLQILLPILSKPRNLDNIPRSHIIDVFPLSAESRECACRQRETHVFGPVDEFEDRRGGLVFSEGFDAEDAGVAAWTEGVAFAEGAEEFGEDGGLFLLRDSSAFLSISSRYSSSDRYTYIEM